MRVLIVENTPGTDFGQIGIALREAKAELHVRRPREGEALPQGFDEHDALIVFGGEQNALDDATHPYLPGLAALMRRFGDAGKPVLGICLGCQVLARAYGGANLIGQAHEFGWHRIHRTDEARMDPVLSAIPDEFSSFQWHGDTFDLPQAAVRLATNAAVANQCFRVGRSAYGMQFHFEANRQVVENWNANFPDIVESYRPGWIEAFDAHAATVAPEADAAGLMIARAWVAWAASSTAAMAAVEA